MSVKAKPIIPDWKLVKNTRSLVIYHSKNLGLSISLTKFKGDWIVDYTDHEMIAKIGKSHYKDDAIGLAKIFMAQHPAPLDTVPLVQPGEKLVLRASKFKNPGRVTQFSRHKR
ncbi:hypothetical protein KAU33_04090 [Candidatus Dependentiae bacterium]|nr:hypothetical protein [Candidatus Dependentiae bacterium]